MTFPDAVRSELADYSSSRHRLAWIELDATGRVSNSGGSLELHGLGGLEGGEEIVERLPMIDLNVEHEIPLVEILPGRFADLVLRKRGENWLLLVLDGTESVRKQRALLQKGNELDLLREHLAARPADRARPGDLLSALGVALLIREPDGTMRVWGSIPGWLPEILPTSRFGTIHESELDETSFLGNFLVDAEQFWAEDRPGSVRSGMWTESVKDRELFLEAIAVADGDHSWLAIELLSDLYEERRLLLQRARETRLDYELLREEIQKKEVLLHCVVHDLKGPLASIVGVVSMLLRTSPTPERTRDLLEIALRQAKRQDQHIRSVLEVFAAEVEAFEAWEPDPALAPDLVAMAREQIERWRPAFGEKRLGLRLELNGEPCFPVVAGMDRLDRVFANLIENALRHAPEDTEVLLRVETGQERGTISIVDHGAGVDEEVVNQLFDRFARGAGGGSSGLGLYFCRRTVERWGGKIHHEPTPGGGATFVVELRALRA